MRILLAIVVFALLTSCAPVPLAAGKTAPLPALTPAAPVYAVTAETLNVRSGPGMEYPVTGALWQGERVRVYERVQEANGGAWCQVAPAAWVWCYWLEEVKK
jgi:uncharacterized protein YraI